MPGQHRSAGPPVRMMPMALYVAGLAFTVVLVAGLVLLGIRWFTAPRPAPATQGIFGCDDLYRSQHINQ
jgi:hypothetical protein